MCYHIMPHLWAGFPVGMPMSLHRPSYSLQYPSGTGRLKNLRKQYSSIEIKPQANHPYFRHDRRPNFGIAI